MTRVERDGEIEESTLVNLLQRAQATRDPGAFDGLYLLYADRVYRYLVVRIHDVERAEEITAQLFLHLIERIDRYRISPVDNVAIFSAWLYRMTHNKMVDAIRKSRRNNHLPIETAYNQPDDRSVPAEVLGNLNRESLFQVLLLLNDHQRDVILLRFFEGYSITETATIMGRTDGAVKALQHRALDNLRRLMKEEV